MHWSGMRSWASHLLPEPSWRSSQDFWRPLLAIIFFHLLLVLLYEREHATGWHRKSGV
jgi:hypothetical protein